MDNAEESMSYVEHSKSKIPFVTWGEVTTISPVSSSDTLHRRGSHHHLPQLSNLHTHHHQHYRHLQTEDDNWPTVESSKCNHHTDINNVRLNSNYGNEMRPTDHRHLSQDYYHIFRNQASQSSLLTYMKEVMFKRERNTTLDSDREIEGYVVDGI